MKSRILRLLLCVLLGLVGSPAAHAGRVSLMVKGSKLALKAGAKEAAEEIAEKALREEAESLTRRFGAQAVAHADSFAQKNGLRQSAGLKLLKDHGPVLARHQFSDEAISFAYRHRGAGIFFLHHPELFAGLQRSIDIGRVPKRVVNRAWRWAGDTNAVGGSLRLLRDALTGAGMNSGTDRDFCEQLFLVKAKAGKIPGISKDATVVTGHIGNSRFGTDFYAFQKGEKLRAIEFGTGRKPDTGELDWPELRRQLAQFFESQTPNQRINLRGAGAPPELINNPARIRDLDFPIERYVQREVYAVEINKKEIARAGSDVVWHELP